MVLSLTLYHFDQIWQMGKFASFASDSRSAPLLLFSVAFPYYFFSNIHNPKIKAKRVGFFPIVEAKSHARSGLKARFRIKYIRRIFFGIGTRVN